MQPTMETAGHKKIGSKLYLKILIAIMAILVIYLTDEGEAFTKLISMQQMNLRFCYQPGDMMNQQSAPISSQCVYCQRRQFDYTLLRCTGISAVQQYINTTQAFCIITQCLEQVPNQRPILLS